MAASRSRWISTRHGRPVRPISEAASPDADSAASSRPNARSPATRRRWSSSRTTEQLDRINPAPAGVPVAARLEQRRMIEPPLGTRIVCGRDTRDPGMHRRGRQSLAEPTLTPEQNAFGERDVVAPMDPNPGAEQRRIQQCCCIPEPSMPLGFPGDQVGSGLHGKPRAGFDAELGQLLENIATLFQGCRASASSWLPDHRQVCSRRSTPGERDRDDHVAGSVIRARPRTDAQSVQAFVSPRSDRRIASSFSLAASAR